MRFDELCQAGICVGIAALLIDRLFHLIGVPQASRELYFNGPGVAYTAAVVFLACCAFACLSPF